MAVKTAVNCDNLTCEKFAFIRSKIYAHIGYIGGAAVTVDHNVIEEDILQNLGYMSLVIGCDDKTRANTVTADIALTVLKSG